jgi:hypothetical protein
LMLVKPRSNPTIMLAMVTLFYSSLK